jgi:hypothetical protein
MYDEFDQNFVFKKTANLFTENLGQLSRIVMTALTPEQKSFWFISFVGIMDNLLFQLKVLVSTNEGFTNGYLTSTRRILIQAP